MYRASGVNPPATARPGNKIVSAILVESNSLYMSTKSIPDGIKFLYAFVFLKDKSAGWIIRPPSFDMSPAVFSLNIDSFVSECPKYNAILNAASSPELSAAILFLIAVILFLNSSVGMFPPFSVAIRSVSNSFKCFCA